MKSHHGSDSMPNIVKNLKKCLEDIRTGVRSQRLQYDMKFHEAQLKITEKARHKTFLIHPKNYLSLYLATADKQRYEVLTPVKMMMFWVVTSCRVTGRY
jgi:hypothetical protein